jgi:branched-chain amino acid aminotransferase
MTSYVHYNGKIYPSGTPLVEAGNRGLRYGDGLFETFRCVNGQIERADWHFERLFSGLKLLAFDIPVHFTPAWLATAVTALCTRNQHPIARVRINLFRGNGGLYDAESHHPHFIIESWPLPGASFELNQNGLVTGIFPDARKAMDSFSHCKHNNYLAYTMAALFAKKQQWNDAFVLNAADRVCDATIANVFIVKDNNVFTCPLTEGCVAGIMRRFLIQNLPAAGIIVTQKPVTTTDLLNADEVFLTNAIKGIRWVRQCGGAVYTNHLTMTIFNNLLRK